MLILVCSTGLPIKDETTETTVRKNEIDTICFLIFMNSCNYKLISFFAKSINKPLKDLIQGRGLDFNLGS